MTILERINTFIDIKGYKNDPHCLGVLFYGSSLTGFNKENSDIDLHVIFDDSDPTHLIRANYVIDDVPIEYFEKTLGEVYLTIENEKKIYAIGDGVIRFENNVATMLVECIERSDEIDLNRANDKVEEIKEKLKNEDDKNLILALQKSLRKAENRIKVYNLGK